MRLNRREPDKRKPCFVLFSRGRSPDRQGHKLSLEQFEWREGAWRRTILPAENPGTLYQGLEKADWIGRLPQQGRVKNVTKTQEEKLNPTIEAKNFPKGTFLTPVPPVAPSVKNRKPEPKWRWDVATYSYVPDD